MVPLQILLHLIIDGTITGLSYEPSYYNYLSTTLNPNRYFPTGSNDTIGVISIPSNLFGEYLKPGTVSISNGTTTFTDDGEGNMTSGSLKYGDVIYEHGMIILTSNGISGSIGYGAGIYGSGVYGLSSINYISSFTTGSNITCSFESTIILYESQYKCTLRENEFNFSQNPTIVSGSTIVGLYMILQQVLIFHHM
jgi:hypothetical protein